MAIHGEVFSLIPKQFKFNKYNKVLISNASASLLQDY